MKKIGIVTLNGEHNYGNRLQNYALQRAIKNVGYQPETLILTSGGISWWAKRFAKSVLGRVLYRSSRAKYWRMLSKKETVFRPFSRKNIQSRIVSKSTSRIIAGEYEVLIVGSDQVWNPRYVGDDETNFLTFAPKEKRVSYAASFGMAGIPTKQQDFYRQHLSEMRSISVREHAGTMIVKSLIGTNAALMPDPTLLIEKKEWEALTKQYDYLADENYVMIYTLHDLDKETQGQIAKLSKDEGVTTYRVMGDFYDASHDIPDPIEFVARIKYARAVFTDSFHASVFSIILHTPFKVVKRKDMDIASRLQTLLETYRLEVAMSREPINSSAYDFDHTDTIVASERARGCEYLSRIIESKEV